VIPGVVVSVAERYHPATRQAQAMKRRAFVTGLGVVLAAPLGAEAQRVRTVPRIGLLGPATPDQAVPFIAVFRQRMRDLEWIEGENFALEGRWAAGKIERFPELAAELVRLNAAVIVAWSTPAVIAVKRATSTIPIVMASSGAAVETGLVASLARPGGNITGLSILGAEYARST
jgi:putative ABC transport system substrate-binding protein